MERNYFEEELIDRAMRSFSTLFNSYLEHLAGLHIIEQNYLKEEFIEEDRRIKLAPTPPFIIMEQDYSEREFLNRAMGLVPTLFKRYLKCSLNLDGHRSPDKKENICWDCYRSLISLSNKGLRKKIKRDSFMKSIIKDYAKMRPSLEEEGIPTVTPSEMYDIMKGLQILVQDQD